MTMTKSGEYEVVSSTNQLVSIPNQLKKFHRDNLSPQIQR